MKSQHHVLSEFREILVVLVLILPVIVSDSTYNVCHIDDLTIQASYDVCSARGVRLRDWTDKDSLVLLTGVSPAASVFVVSLSLWDTAAVCCSSLRVINEVKLQLS